MRFFWKRTKTESALGFSETMVSLFLLSVVLLVLFRLFSQMAPTVQNSLEKSQLFRHQLILRKTLTHSFLSIQPPWWIREYPLECHGDEWRFPYRNGMEAEMLIIKKIDDRVVILNNDQIIQQFAGIHSFRLTLLTGRTERLIAKVEINGRMDLFPLGGFIYPGKELP